MFSSLNLFKNSVNVLFFYIRVFHKVNYSLLTYDRQCNRNIISSVFIENLSAVYSYNNLFLKNLICSKKIF